MEFHARIAQQMSPARVNRAARTFRVAPQGAACSLLNKICVELSFGGPLNASERLPAKSASGRG